MEDKLVRTRVRIRLTRQAIDLAMQGKWREAIETNTSLIDNDHGDIDAYNRLGRAYLEVGDYSQARLSYSKAIELDQNNIIACKNLNRLQRLDEASVAVAEPPNRIEPRSFLEETGKAGVVALYDLGDESVVASLLAGDTVLLKIEGKKLVVQNNRGDYVGLVEPKHANRLIRLMCGGNQYNANIISNEGRVKIMLRETYQDPSQAGQVSFLARRFERIQSHISDRLFSRQHDKEEEEEGGDIDSGRWREEVDNTLEERHDFDYERVQRTLTVS
jgi:tetratricopeptide (TPR) repeat protein